MDMNIVMTGAGKFIEVQGTAEREPFDTKLMQKMIAAASIGIKELIAVQRKTLGKIISL